MMKPLNEMRLLTAIALILAAAATGRAQVLPYQTGGDTIVSLVTFFPGSEIYELEGHTALRITSPQADMAVNYGLFDFNTPHFVYRFVAGETDYCVGAIPWEYMRESYVAEGRRIVERRLNLTSAQKHKLFEILGENLRPENRRYRYNYVLDNCATRPLEALEAAAGGQFKLGTADDGTAGLRTFRDLMRHYHRNYPWYQLGIDLALGWDIDREEDARAHVFAPVALDLMIAEATTADGTPLVSETVAINDVAEDNAVLGATPWYLTPLAVFTLWLALVVGVTWYDARRRRESRWLDTVLFGVYGLGGCVTFFLVFVSQHYASTRNLVALWLNPMLLLIAVGVWIKGWKKLVLWVQMANFAIIFVLAVAWPLLPQSGNAAFVPAALAEAVRLGYGITLRHNIFQRRKNQ